MDEYRIDLEKRLAHFQAHCEAVGIDPWEAQVLSKLWYYRDRREKMEQARNVATESPCNKPTVLSAIRKWVKCRFCAG